MKLIDLAEDFTTGYRTKSFQERFWDNVTVAGPDDCWVWTGTIGNNGYGRMSVNCKYHSVHRLSYLIAHGEINDKLLVIHSCDNKPCVNPKHLSQDVHAENARQAMERGRVCARDRNGMARLSESDVEAIRVTYEHALVTQDEIARAYGIGNPQVSRIINHKSWR